MSSPTRWCWHCGYPDDGDGVVIDGHWFCSMNCYNDPPVHEDTPHLENDPMKNDFDLFDRYPGE